MLKVGRSSNSGTKVLVNSGECCGSTECKQYFIQLKLPKETFQERKSKCADRKSSF